LSCQRPRAKAALGPRVTISVPEKSNLPISQHRLSRVRDTGQRSRWLLSPNASGLKLPKPRRRRGLSHGTCETSRGFA
jgi:hypothetical protein